MAVLLEIDAAADQELTFSFGEQASPGESAPVMHELGTEKHLNLRLLRKHYDALGSFVHVQSLKQRLAGETRDYGAMRARCETIATYVEEVLASRVFNSVFGTFTTLECQRCSEKIRRRIPAGKEKISATCFNCRAGYFVEDLGDGRSHWLPDEVDLTCSNPACREVSYAFRSDVELGSWWVCEACNGHNEWRLGIAYLGPANLISADGAARLDIAGASGEPSGEANRASEKSPS